MKKGYVLCFILLLITLSGCDLLKDSNEVEETEKVDIIERLENNSGKYAKHTNGLDGDQKSAVIGAVDFYFALETENFDSIPNYLSEHIPQDPKIISEYYKETYAENEIDLIGFEVVTIELDKETEDSIVIRVELKQSIQGEIYTQTDEVTVRKDSDDKWRVYSTKLVKR